MSSHRSGYSLTVGRSRKEDDFNVEQSVFNNLPDSSNPKFLELSPRKRLKPPKIPSPAKSRHSTLLPETPRKSEDLNHDKRQRRSLPSDQGRTNRKSAVSLEDDRSDYQHGENSLSTTLSLTPQSTPRDTSRRFSDNPNINVSRSEYSSHLSDSSRRIDYALVLLREAIVDNRPEKAKLAKYHISQFSNDLAEHRMKRKSKTPSKPKLQDNEFGEITKLVAMAISARKVCERSTNNSTSTETLRVLKDVGALTILAQGLAEGVIQPETSGGRAILSVLSEASAVPETQVAVTDAFKTDPPRLARVCHGIMKNKHHPVAARNQTARIVKNSSVDPDVKRRMLSEVGPSRL